MHAWEQIQKTIDYIEENISQEMDMKELADIASLSSFYYQRLFKRLVKKTVMEYVRLRRMARAAEIMRQTKERILDVALSVGFTSHEQFTRGFRDTFGMTPKDYRKDPITLNCMTKPQLDLNYTLIDENEPLIVGDIVLDIGRRYLERPEKFIGIEVKAPVSFLQGIGVQSGKDPLSDVWDRFHRIKTEVSGFLEEELGALYPNDEEGVFNYFAGGQLEQNIREKGIFLLEKYMQQEQRDDNVLFQIKERDIVSGEYLVISIEAETFERLVTDVIYKANQYIYNIWMPANHLKNESHQLERYIKRTDHLAKMEIWIELNQKQEREKMQNNIEIIELEEEIRIVALNLQKSGLPITFDSLGKMWELYTEEQKDKILNRKKPEIQYGICLNKIPDYLVGSEVTEIGSIENCFISYVIPKGKYIKVFFQAENFSELVNETMEQKQKEAKKWAKSNKIKINREYTIEVYPQEMVQKEMPEMYCLLPILL